MVSSNSLGDHSKKKDIEIEFFSQVVSELFCSIRVKMKELTFNVTCAPMIDFANPHLNMKIKIKRADQDTKIEDVR